MIYTVTLNPAIDYVITIDQLKTGNINRIDTENVYPGGKGINVSSILGELGINSTALGFISGFSGEFIKNTLHKKGLDTDFIELDNGFTRINVKIKSDKETEINGQGPHISDEKLNQLYNKLDSLTSEDILVLAGSIPNTLDDKLYENIMKRLESRNVKIVVDATKNLLLNVLKYNPFLIKPNNHELEEIFDVKLETTQDIVTYAKKLQDMGAENVLVSRGKDGAVLVSKEGCVYQSNVGKGKVVNSVGAGDSMVAGFVGAYIQTNDFENALKQGAACGSATAFSSDLATKNYIDEISKDIVVEKIM